MNNKGGRPAKLTDDVKETLVDCIKMGMTFKAACRYAGIAYSTFANWMSQGKESESEKYSQLFLTIEAEKKCITEQNRNKRFSHPDLLDFRYGRGDPTKAEIALIRKEVYLADKARGLRNGRYEFLKILKQKIKYCKPKLRQEVYEAISDAILDFDEYINGCIQLPQH